jgi:hypothetical protein
VLLPFGATLPCVLQQLTDNAVVESIRPTCSKGCTYQCHSPSKSSCSKTLTATGSARAHKARGQRRG